MKLADLKLNPDNPRNIKPEKLDKLAQSIKDFPKMMVKRPIVYDENKIIIGGNMRYKAIEKLGMTEIPDEWTSDASDFTPEERKRFIMQDNAEMGETDWDLVANQYELEDLDAWGIDVPYADTEDVKEDDPPEVGGGDAISALGTVYQLGSHRVMCGDSTSEDDVKTLFGSNRAKLIFTSPPYNMDSGMYENYEDNMARQEYIDFNLNIVNLWKKHLDGFIFWNISYNKNARDEFIEIIYRMVKETGLMFLELIVWNKKTAMPITSKSGMTRQYEDILVVGDEETIKEDFELNAILRNTKDAFFNLKTKKWLRNYWEISPINSQLDNHKACYPVNLPARAIRIMTQEKDIVADPFLGSGSSLIACEQTNRVCLGMEIDPKYIDVIRKRYQKFITGSDEGWEEATPPIERELSEVENGK